jgi:predicted nucleic acid-binding protein
VVPADDKENARLIVMQVILETFRALKQSYPAVSSQQAKDLRTIRKQLAK